MTWNRWLLLTLGTLAAGLLLAAAGVLLLMALRGAVE